MGLFYAARPSRAPLNPRAMQRGTRYCRLNLRTPEHLGLYTGIQFSTPTFKTVLKQAGKRVSQDTADSVYPRRDHLYLIFNIYF